MSRLSTLLIKGRKKAGLTQVEVSQKLNFHQQNISNYERNLAKPPLYVLREICDLYGITRKSAANAMVSDYKNAVNNSLEV